MHIQLILDTMHEVNDAKLAFDAEWNTRPKDSKLEAKHMRAFSRVMKAQKALREMLSMLPRRMFQLEADWQGVRDILKDCASDKSDIAIDLALQRVQTKLAIPLTLEQALNLRLVVNNENPASASPVNDVRVVSQENGNEKS